MYRLIAIATGSMVLMITGCSTNSGFERSAALYVAQNEITANCDRNATCVDKWDVAHELLRENTLANKNGRDIFFGNDAGRSDNLEASLTQNVWKALDDSKQSGSN